MMEKEEKRCRDELFDIARASGGLVAWDDRRHGDDVVQVVPARVVLTDLGVDVLVSGRRDVGSLIAVRAGFLEELFALGRCER